MCAIDSSTTRSSRSRGPAGCAKRPGIVRRLWRGAADEQGSNAIEMTAIVMFLMILISGIVDLGGAYQHYMVVINASREGARMYSRLPCTSTNRAFVKQAAVNAAVTEAAASRVKIDPSNVSVIPDPAGACPPAGATVTVQVKDNYQTLMGSFLGVNTFPIRGQTKMMFYGTDQAESA